MTASKAKRLPLASIGGRQREPWLNGSISDTNAQVVLPESVVTITLSDD